MPKMVAPRALVFRPLVKGNGDSGNEIACTAERSFSNMKRLKTPSRSTMADGRLSFSTSLHIRKYQDVDIDDVITEFARMKGRSLALCL